MSPSEFVGRRNSGELWQLLDVREPWEIELASVDDAIHMPVADVATRVKELDANRPLAVLCHSGGRSARVARYLDDLGFASVANITGGIDAWSQDVDPAIARY